ncbi:hypothetical protein BDV18DRAFT_1104 [Aspergillus unguis]
MDTGSPPQPPDNGFGHQSPWMDMNGFHPQPHPHPPQHSPPIDYHSFGYNVVPMDPSYPVTIPPPYAPPMTVPSNAWPSMLTTTSQSPFQPPELPAATPGPAQSHDSGPGPCPNPGPVAIAPSVSPIAPVPPPRKSSTSSSTPRRMLTDDDRRRMCLYHEENKTAKQTDIGALFGVERR